MALQFPRLKTLLVMFLFVVGRFPRNYGYRVKAAITVQNWTRFPLIKTALNIAEGVNDTAAHDIYPGSQWTFNVRKRDRAPQGTYGTVSWVVSGKDQRFIVMWSAPYSFNWYSNWLGLGMTPKGHTKVAIRNTWFIEMYYTGGNKYLRHTIKEFYKDVNPVTFRMYGFKIVGTMTSGHHTEILVKFQPTQKGDAAPGYEKQLGFSK
uniref:Coluporin-23 n=1 Tax=Colubraria reticulata TaxID=604273 RepID=A0A499RKF0_9CAEN|nr:coluporin-23 [Colubraria reticulata]